jgi:predicted methyltransferase
MNKKLALALGASTLLFAACGKKTETSPAPATEAAETPAVEPAPPAVDYAAIANAAVADASRPADDRARDAGRKTAETLAFMQVAPGMTVFDIEAGSGFYTELLSRAVGAEGSVVLQNPASFYEYFGEGITARLLDGRLGNVRESKSMFDALDGADATYDLVTWVQGPHEVFYKPEQGPSLGEPAKAYAEIYRILKKGGAFVVVDHSAVAGAPETTGNDLHRIDKAIVIAMAEAAGLTLEAESDLLANPEDPRTIGVFDEAIRGKTDQFMLRFRK